MSPAVSSKAAPIVIVGAGVFGLSTAIHLARRGYTNVTILDKQAYDESQYSYAAGCDAASADINKIMRAIYGSQVEYQELALDALSQWREWNTEIEAGKGLPPGFTSQDRLFVNNGVLVMNSDASLTQFEVDSIRNMTASGYAGTQIDLTSPDEVDHAVAGGFGFAVNPFGRSKNYGQLDTTGGFVYADRACCFALHKAKALGVKTVLGGSKGTFSTLLRDQTSKIIGVKTTGGGSHLAELTIMACGGWTPSLMPDLDNLCETTCGSVSIFQLPSGSPLWDRFAPQNFPTWMYKMRDGEAGGLYGFARDSSGSVKIGYRGTKYTNPQTQADGTVRSVPVTRWTQESIRQIPETAASVIRGFVQDFLPELIPCEVETRLCWYTDSFDNHFVIDFVPRSEGLMVATGGSGHGFKFLPNLGGHVVDRIEGKTGGLLDSWKWRSSLGHATPYNSIMDGASSKRALQRQVLTKENSLSKQQSSL